MFIPFLPQTEARAILDEAWEGEAQAAEYEADLGSSYFYGGASSWDASSMARMDRLEREAEFAATEEGELYFARLEAARFLDSALNGTRLTSQEEADDFRIFTPVGGTVIPEFTIPFERPVAFTPDPDDIPF